jgi:hypothetical protein
VENTSAQQRSELFASLWSLMRLPVIHIHVCALSFILVCVCLSLLVLLHLWFLAATPLFLPGAGPFTHFWSHCVCQIKLPSLQSIRLSTNTNGCAFGPKKASKVEKPSSRGVSSLHRVVPIFYTSSLAHALALSAHMYVCLLLCVYSALRGCHTAAPSRSWDQ